MKINIPAFNLLGGDDGLVDMSASTGVGIYVDSLDKLESLQALPPDQLPLLVHLGVFLNDGLFSNLSPPEDTKTKKPVSIESGTSKAIRIDVGKKP